MIYGLQIINQDGFVQIDADFECARKIASGTCSGPTPSWWGCPRLVLHVGAIADTRGLIVLVKPSQFGKWVGGLGILRQDTPFPPDATLFQDGASAGIAITIEGQVAFDYAVFHTLGNPLAEAVSYGLDVVTPEGKFAYSSRYSYPTLETVAQVFPRWVGYSSNYPIDVPLNGYTSMPWILLNSLIISGKGSGGDGGLSGSMCAKVDSLSSMKIGLRVHNTEMFEAPDVNTNGADSLSDPYSPHYIDGSNDWSNVSFTVGASRFYG
jgi:hypothetical protein